jgi:phage terminase large subunit-like protein
VTRKRSSAVDVCQRAPGKKEQTFPEFRASLQDAGKRAYTLRNFVRFCGYLRTEDGQPLKLEAFQKRVLKDHFSGAIEEVVVISKKNGKTTLFSALGLFHLLVIVEAEVVIGASSRDQATVLFNQAANMIRRSELEDIFDIKGGYRHIRFEGSENSRIRVLAADAKTADGVIPTLALVDELHRHPNGDLYGVFRDGLDARDGRMVTMSTAGLKEDSPLGQLRAKAQKMSSYKRKGVYSSAKSQDGSFVLHEWSLTNEDDLDNLKLVKKANPASWQTIVKLRRRKESPTMTPGRWARFACGVWTEGEDPWIEAKQWDGLRVDIGQIEPLEQVWAAVDVGTNPAICLAASRPDEAVAVKAFSFEGSVPLEVIENKLVEISEAYALEEIAYDRVGFNRSAELLEERGLPMFELPHSPERMSIVSMTLLRLIDAGKLRHDGDQALRAQVLAGATKETERGWRLVKSFRNRALIAMAVACHQATQVQHDDEPLVMWR